MMQRGTTNWMAWAQLVRLPNLFTAVADPLAGWWIAGMTAGNGNPWVLPGILATSVFLYAAGMVLNDCFDYRVDCRERQGRPLPRGVIPLQAAWINGWSLLVAGIVVALAADATRWWIALALALAVVVYNAGAKKSALLGPVTMGLCRFLNFTLGMGLAGLMSDAAWVAPVLLAVYVMALSGIARSEAVNPARRGVVKRLLQGIVVVDAVLVVAFTWPQPDWLGAVLVVSLLAPVLALSRTVEMT